LGESSQRMKTFLVTGAAGLIGSSVVRQLVQQGFRVIAFDNFSIGDWNEEKEELIWEKGDIGTVDFGSLSKGSKIEAVVHCAAHPGGRSLQEPSENVRVNTFGSMRLFEWCTRNQVKVVYLSSSIIYGEQPAGGISETATLNAGTIYGACKVACENYLRILQEGYGLQWVILRLFATYGQGHKPNVHQGIVNVLLTQLLAGNQVVVKGSLKRLRDFIYVEDTTKAITTCLLNANSYGQILNVGSGESLSIMELIERLCHLLGKPMKDISILEEGKTVGDPLYNVADVTKIKNLIGFATDFDLNKGLSLLIHARTHK